jgi:hypothetical protein
MMNKKRNNTKSAKKAAKRLKNAKKLEATKPLMVMAYKPEKDDGTL